MSFRYIAFVDFLIWILGVHRWVHKAHAQLVVMKKILGKERQLEWPPRMGIRWSAGSICQLALTKLDSFQDMREETHTCDVREEHSDSCIHRQEPGVW